MLSDQELTCRLQEAKRCFDFADVPKAIKMFEAILPEIPEQYTALIARIRTNISEMKEELDYLRKLGKITPPSPFSAAPAKAPRAKLGKKVRSASTSDISQQVPQEITTTSEDDPLASFDPAIASRALATKQNVENLSLDSIAGMENVKSLIYKNFILPKLCPEFFTGLREPMKRLLLYGAPGCGKTMTAAVIASLSNRQLFLVNIATLASKWRGDGETILAAVFALARHHSPSIVVFDEIDTLIMSRDENGTHEASKRLMGQCLVEMDGFSNKSQATDIVIIATTNCPWNLDKAMIRRFPYRVYLPLCNSETRRQLLGKILTGTSVSDEVDFNEIAQMLDNFSADDIVNVCKKAAMRGLDRLAKLVESRDQKPAPGEIQMPVTRDDFVVVIQGNSPSVSLEITERYEDWKKKHGAE